MSEGVSKQVSGDRPAERPSALAELVKLGVELYAVRPDLVKGAIVGAAIVGLALLYPSSPAPEKRR